MKKGIQLTMIFLTLSLLTGCQSDTSTTSLSPNTRPTSRLPSPGNIHANTVLQSTTMSVPQPAQ